MILYVLRHGEAVEAEEAGCDEWRYLTENGRATVDRISKQMAGEGHKARLIICSPLVRAVQTAQIAAAHAGRKNKVVVHDLLLPGGDIDELVTHLKAFSDAKRVMVVGHEPQLGSLVAALLRINHGISLKKASCVALELSAEDDGKAAGFLWYALPGKKPVTALRKAFPAR